MGDNLENIDITNKDKTDTKPKHNNLWKRWAYVVGGVIATPIILILLFAVALYLPPVQNWAVHTASRYASDATGMDITVGSVHLAFPIDFRMNGVRCTQINDSLPQRRDTIAEIKEALVDVRLWPLLDNKVEVNSLELTGAKMNTADFIHEARIKGTVGRLGIYTKNLSDDRMVGNVNLDRSLVNLDIAELDNAHLDIALSDTVPEDTTKTENLWVIHLNRLAVTQSDVMLHMPGDTMQVALRLNALEAEGGDIDLHKGRYKIAHVGMKDCAVRYDNNFERYATSGFDANHIALNDIQLAIDSIDYWMGDSLLPGNKGNMTASARIRQCSMKEQSGITLKSLAANIDLDTTQVHLDAKAETPYSCLTTLLHYDAKGKVTKMDENGMPPGTLNGKLQASIGRQDLMTFALAGMPEAFRKAWPMAPLNMSAEIMGNIREVTIPDLTIELPTAFALDAHGNAKGFMALAKDMFAREFKAKLHADLKTYNMNFVKSLLDKGTAKMINIPSMHAQADVDISGADYAIAFKGGPNAGQKQRVGNVTADARVNLAAMRYDAKVKANALNLGAFVKGMGLGTLTGDIKAKGQGTDMFNPKTTLDAEANIKHCGYGRYNLNNIIATANIRNGKVEADVNSRNELVNGNVTLDALMNIKHIKATVMSDIRNADLYNLFLVDAPLKFTLCGHVDVESDLDEYYKVQGLVSDIIIHDSAHTFRPDDVVLDLLTRPDTTTVHAYCGDFETKLNAQGGYKRLMKSGDGLMASIKNQVRERTIDQTALRDNLPKISLFLTSGSDNPVARMIKYYGLDFNSIYVDMNTSKEHGINGDMHISRLSTQGFRLDSIDMKMRSKDNPNDISYEGHIQNVAPNDYVFEAFFDGNVLEHGVSLNTKLFDNKNKEALRLGAEAIMEQNGIRLHLTPKTPILGYEKFALNKENYVLLERSGKIHANVDLLADNGTGIKVYCTDNDNEPKEEGNEEEKEEEEDLMQTLQDLTLSINKLDIGKVIATIPYAPNVQGMMDGDFHVVQNADNSLAISTDMHIQNMTYEGCRMGNIGTDMVYMPMEDGSHHIDGFISMDDVEVGTIKGAYNMETSAIDAKIECNRFPLMVANGFIPDQIIGLEGYADGELTIKGTTVTPRVDGELMLTDAALISVPYGVRMRFDDDPVRIEGSKLLFENFQMYASNNSPLVCMGEVDFSNTEHITTNLRMRAKNFQVIDAKQTRRSEAYGKAFVNLYCMVNGELDKLQVKGKLDVLPTTDLFYILKDSPITTDNRLKELVTFTDFSDTTQVATKRPTVDGMQVDFTIGIDEGVHATCWLNANHTNYLDVIGGGDLRMIYTTEQMKLNGRYTITEGEMKYALPIIPLKTFTIAPDSYIEFTGDMMNPRLSITATENTKAAVNDESIGLKDQMVMFDCGVVISKTLNDMGLQFIIDAPENQSVADYLNMRSAEERGKLAVTMLTTGMFLTDGNTSSFSMNSALNTFLQSEINRLAGSALKTMDLSFGMDNSTEEDGTMHTNYTFKFAKRFWNNRISISIGGKISTGPDVSGQNKSFFDNAELQYRLSDTSNQYLHMFYKNSVYDYLEGYVSQYSGGYMYKKKMQTLKELFGSSSTASPNMMQNGKLLYRPQNAQGYVTAPAATRENTDSIKKTSEK